VFALFLREKGVEKGASATALLPLAFPPVLVAIAAVAGANFLSGEPKGALYFLAAGAAWSTIVTLVSGWRSTSMFGDLVYGLGLASFVVGASLGAATVDSAVKLGGLVVGLAVGALPALGVTRSRAGLVGVAVVFAAGIATMIARIGYSPPMDQIGVLVCWTALLALAGRWGAEQAFGKKNVWPTFGIAVVLFSALVWVLVSVYFGQGDVALVAVVSVAAVLLTAWAVPTKSPAFVSWGTAAVIWLGLATFAFSQSFGMGMAVGGLCGVVCALLIGRADLLPAVGVLTGLSYYRLFREQNAEVVQAFDIGQHYAMIGFVLGIVVLVGLSDGLMRRRASWSGRGHVSAAIVGLIAAILVVGASAFFGPKGAIGLSIGLALAPLVARLTSAGSPWTLVGSMSLQAAVIVAYQPLAWDLSLDRDGKIRLLIWLGCAIVVLLGALWFVDRTKKEVQVEPA
jgi:hypothetical protein